jgi:membrane peptidoglycan carboxypeptidase
MRPGLRRGGLLLAGALLLFVAYEVFALWRAWQRTPAVVSLARTGPLTLEDLSPERRRWLLAVEDPGFERHRGIDFTTPGQGNTTLPQSLVKLFYFERFRPGFAKIEQVLIARLVLDRALTKHEQLRAYLNHAYFGESRRGPIIGFEGAARAYFGTPFARIDDDQFLAIVATSIAPRELDPRRHPGANAERVRRIKRLVAGSCAPEDLGDVRYRRC